MINRNSLQLCSLIGLALLLAGVGSPVLAGEEEYYDFPTGEHEGGGVRGKGIGCVALEANNPQPFIPQESQALTISPVPELLFYVPDVDQASTLDLLLLDQDDRVVSRTEFQPGVQPGIVSLNLVDQSNNNVLRLNSSYSWYLIQECAGHKIPKVVASGSLKRIELESSLALKLQHASLAEKIKLYQGANIWHEAIANLAQLKCSATAEPPSFQTLIEVDENYQSSNLFSQSLDTYCSANLKAESIAVQ
ncbi:MAG: DUF928 domain-containing protein [Cyanobacteria bacterium J06643_13]